MIRPFTPVGSVNNTVRAYFSEFGAQIGHTLMDKSRMEYIFRCCLTDNSLTHANEIAITKWLKDNA
jgi:hypothetical protein